MRHVFMVLFTVAMGIYFFRWGLLALLVWATLGWVLFR